MKSILEILGAMLFVLLAGLAVAIAPTLVRCAMAAPPGHGPAEQQEFRANAPVIAALAAYRRARGHYPERLEALSPRFIPASEVPNTAYHRGRYDPALGGDNDDPQGYRLTFHYNSGRWGQDYCDYVSPPGEWHCLGEK